MGRSEWTRDCTHLGAMAMLRVDREQVQSGWTPHPSWTRLAPLLSRPLSISVPLGSILALATLSSLVLASFSYTSHAFQTGRSPLYANAPKTPRNAFAVHSSDLSFERARRLWRDRWPSTATPAILLTRGSYRNSIDSLVARATLLAPLLRRPACSRPDSVLRMNRAPR